MALDLLKNANIAAGGVLPMCQDTGTAIVMGKKGERVLTGGGDEEALARGVFDAYTQAQPALLADGAADMWDEKNTGTNLPAQIELYAPTRRRVQVPLHGQGRRLGEQVVPLPGDEGGPESRGDATFLEEKIRSLGTAACPPYHLAVVIGGTSAEYALKTAKLASARYLDTLPTAGIAHGHGFRDLALEAQVLELTRELGIGAQFGGKYFCHDVRVVRLPRHGASCPVGDRGVVLGGPPGAGQDHAGGRVPRAAGDRPRALPARGDRRAPRRRRRPASISTGR